MVFGAFVKLVWFRSYCVDCKLVLTRFLLFFVLLCDAAGRSAPDSRWPRRACGDRRSRIRLHFRDSVSQALHSPGGPLHALFLAITRCWLIYRVFDLQLSLNCFSSFLLTDTGNVVGGSTSLFLEQKVYF